MSKTLAPRFAFVLEHARIIDGATRSVCAGTLLAFEDFRSELVVDLVETFEKWSPDRGAPSTWIYMRARHIRRGMVRQSVRNTFAPLLDTDALPETAAESAARVEARVDASRLLAGADRDERLAAISVLRDWTPSDVRDRLGCCTNARDRRLARLASND
jgi:hypothetical protein